MAMQSGDDREVLRTAVALMDAGEPFVLMTVVRTQGSTPRNAGAKMIWCPDAGAGTNGLLHQNGAPNGTAGTVGGGHFERLVLDAARSCFEGRRSGMERFVLGADADQCCGGTMEVFLEYRGCPARVVIFGAGHVAHALARLLEASSIAVMIVDDRPDWNSAERFPRARRVHSWEDGVVLARRSGGSTLALVMTCSHETDFDLLRALLTDPGPAQEILSFVGLIGSRSKRACLFSRLVASGIEQGAVSRVRCPIGVGDTGKEPQAVAISVAAQVLMEARSLAVSGSVPKHAAV